MAREGSQIRQALSRNKKNNNATQRKRFLGNTSKFIMSHDASCRLLFNSQRRPTQWLISLSLSHISQEIKLFWNCYTTTSRCNSLPKLKKKKIISEKLMPANRTCQLKPSFQYLQLDCKQRIIDETWEFTIVTHSQLLDNLCHNMGLVWHFFTI